MRARRAQVAPVAQAVFIAYGVVALVHLGANVAGAEGLSGPTQMALMPLLALALALAAPRPYTWLVGCTFVALGFSWLGDTLPRFLSGDPAFLGMVGMFLLAQIAYSTGFWPWRAESGLRRPPILFVYALYTVSLVALCWTGAGVLAPAIVVYGLALVTMAVLAVGVNPMVAVGAAIFVISDGLIAVKAFVPTVSIPQVGPLIMLTYSVAQLLIVLGVLQEARAGYLDD